MRDIIISMKDESKVDLSEISQDAPIFAYRNGELRGMVVKEEEGWLVKVGAFGHAYVGAFGHAYGGSYGYFGTREKCVQVGVDNYSYTFKTI